MVLAFLVILATGPQPAYRAADVTVSYVSGTSPTYVLGLDNNLDICLAATQPVALDDLRARGLAISDSQRVLLQAFAILKRTEDGRYRCEVPVLRGEVASHIRQEAKAIAVKIAERTAQSRRAFLQVVAEDAKGASPYPLLASLVLDSLVWKQFEASGAMTSADPGMMPSGSKLWSGIAWIILPPPETKFGTNSNSTGGSELFITWTPAALPAINKITPEVRAALLAGTADLSVPVIRKDSRIYRTGQQLAAETAAAFAKELDYDAFAKSTGIADRSKATLILWHEVFPALMSAIGGEVATPAVLLGKDGAVREVMFIVRE